MENSQDNTQVGWDIARNNEVGVGNWRAYCQLFGNSIDPIISAAEAWKKQVKGVSKPWLCWNVCDRWCLLQQKLILEVGWTPIVGWDPNCKTGPPSLVRGALAVDFNAELKLPVMWVHWPLEFAFLWTEKLAFWHSDLILPRKKMQKSAKIFDDLQDGETAAVFSLGGLKNIFRFRSHRYWELLGCTTQSAGKNQFKEGCGWWRIIGSHINAPRDAKEQNRRRLHADDHGAGIRYWEKYYGGKVVSLRESWLKKEHFSVTSVRSYKRGRSKAEEMEQNFDLERITRDFGIADLVD